VDFVNNVVYNWGMKAIYGGEEGWFNVRNNYFRPGPATRILDGEWLDISTSETTSMIPGNFHVSGNRYDVSAVRKGNSEGKLPDYVKITGRQRVYEENSKKPFAIRVSLPEQDADAAYKAVLKSAGASQKRDALDRRIISEVKKGLALYKGSVTGIPGIIDNEDDVLNTK
jgi:hypothetical protein